MTDDAFDIEDEAWLCWNCTASEPPIFLCGSGGWICEQCFRDLSGISEDVQSDDIHDGINDGLWKPEIARVNAIYYAEIEED